MPSQSLYVNFYLLSILGNTALNVTPWCCVADDPICLGPAPSSRISEQGRKYSVVSTSAAGPPHPHYFIRNRKHNNFLIGSVANFPVKSERITGKRSLLRNCTLNKVEILIEMEIYLYSSKHDIIIDNINWIVMSFSAKFKRRKRYKFGECLHLLIFYSRMISNLSVANFSSE